MICPNCKGELSRVWQPKQASQVISIAEVRWNCSTCGEMFTSQQLRPAKRQAKTVAAPLEPV
jgi:transcriptional regulator NrdR family protein